MEQWMIGSALPMAVPAPWSFFHIVFTLLGGSAAGYLAWRCRHFPEKRLRWIFFGIGVLLFAGEWYKQLFLYYVVNGKSYDWWYFPFQLCSLPMYLCLALPWIPSVQSRALLYTFLLDFNLLGALMVFLVPDGMFYPYWNLTLHSLMWHLLLVFVGSCIGFGGLAEEEYSGYRGAAVLFLAASCMATVINVAAHPFGETDMFYISPYHPSAQPVFHRISMALGIPAGIAVYLAAVCAGACLLHGIYRFLRKRR